MLEDLVIEFLRYLSATPCHISIYKSGIDEDGAENVSREVDKMCYFQNDFTHINGDKSVGSDANCECYIVGDLDPSEQSIRGTVTVFGVDYEISNSKKALGPKGKVAFTRLLLK